MTERCSHCNKEFVNSSTRNRHEIAIHTSVRHEHRCTTCGTEFARKDALRRHTRTKHTHELMQRCQFCLEDFRKDYFARHESRCAIKYWTKVCRNAELTNEIQDDQSIEINGRLPVRRDMSSDPQLDPASGNRLRVVHEIDINVRLASEAFNVAFRHYWKTENIESCLEAITASFRLSVPIKSDPRGFSFSDPFYDLSLLAQDVGEYIRGERDINDLDMDFLEG